jgi:hypothetical protein
LPAAIPNYLGLMGKIHFSQFPLVKATELILPGYSFGGLRPAITDASSSSSSSPNGGDKNWNFCFLPLDGVLRSSDTGRLLFLELLSPSMRSKSRLSPEASFSISSAISLVGLSRWKKNISKNR